MKIILTLTQLVYTVGNEQEYHFRVLFLILKKLGYAWAENCYHLSYGMVDLPSGKMKSREGTVVDADDLMQEMADTAKARTSELGKIEGFNEEQANALYETLGLGALKYFLLKVDPKKRMLFNPAGIHRIPGKHRAFYPIYVCEDQSYFEERPTRWVLITQGLIKTR